MKYKEKAKLNRTTTKQLNMLHLCSSTLSELEEDWRLVPTNFIRGYSYLTLSELRTVSHI